MLVSMLIYGEVFRLAPNELCPGARLTTPALSKYTVKTVASHDVRFGNMVPVIFT